MNKIYTTRMSIKNIYVEGNKATTKDYTLSDSIVRNSRTKESNL